VEEGQDHELELEAADLLDKALGFMSAQNWQAAAAAPEGDQGKKYETTKTRARSPRRS
jgi:hypothetical protein